MESFIHRISTGNDMKVVKSFLEMKDRPMKFICIDATHFKIKKNGIYGNMGL